MSKDAANLLYSVKRGLRLVESTKQKPWYRCIAEAVIPKDAPNFGYGLMERGLRLVENIEQQIWSQNTE
jgi:hypothetical protein